MTRPLKLMLFAFAWPCFALGQDSGPPHALEGTWRTGERNGSWGYVAFAACGSAYCGTLVDGGGVNVNPEYFGTKMVTGMHWTGSEFTDGRLLDVETGQVYLSRMAFRDRDRLRVWGCVLGGLLCGSQVWTRVK